MDPTHTLEVKHTISIQLNLSSAQDGGESQPVVRGVSSQVTGTKLVVLATPQEKDHVVEAAATRPSLDVAPITPDKQAKPGRILKSYDWWKDKMVDGAKKHELCPDHSALHFHFKQFYSHYDEASASADGPFFLTRFYLSNIFQDNREVSHLGARYDPDLKMWYVPPLHSTKDLTPWIHQRAYTEIMKDYIFHPEGDLFDSNKISTKEQPEEDRAKALLAPTSDTSQFHPMNKSDEDDKSSAFIARHCERCPGCKQAIDASGVEHIKLRCPSCKHVWCKMCQQQWTPNNHHTLSKCPNVAAFPQREHDSNADEDSEDDYNDGHHSKKKEGDVSAHTL